MKIYNLISQEFLELDVNYLVGEINCLYDIQLEKGKPSFKRSLITLPPNQNWSSPESVEFYNYHIPRIKNLIRGMYSVIESLERSSNDGQFNRDKLTKRYKNFNELRLLNNQFKHYKIDEAEISLTFISIFDGNSTTFDVLFNFKLKKDNISRYVLNHNLVILFIEILYSYEFIKPKD